MPDFHGPIQHVVVARTLWMVLAFPAAVTAGILGFGAWRSLSYLAGVPARPLEVHPRDVIARLSVGGAAASLLFSAYHAWALFAEPPGERYFFDHLWRMVRVGQLDASFDLVLDPLSASVAVVVTAAAIPALFAAARALEGDRSFVRRLASLNGLFSSVVLVILADNFVLLLIGWGGVALASWGLVGLWWKGAGAEGAGARGVALGRVGDAALLLGAALLYWGLGGAWQDGDYVPALGPRFSSVEVGSARPSSAAGADESSAPTAADSDESEDEPGEPAADGAADGAAPAQVAVAPPGSASAPSTPPPGDGFLTLTSYSGAVVFMDDTRAPLERSPGVLLRAPFVRVPVKAGTHSFRVHLGSSVEDAIVSHVVFGGGKEIALAAFGPTVTFRSLRDQLGVRDARGQAPVREALLAGKITGGWTVLVTACLLFCAGAFARTASAPLYAWDASEGRGAAALAHQAALVVTAGYFLARLGFLFLLSPRTTAVGVAGALALVAGVAVWAFTWMRASGASDDAAPVVARWADGVARRVVEPALAASGAFLSELDARVVGGVVGAGALGVRALAWVFAHADDAVVDGAARAGARGVMRVAGRVDRMQSGRVQSYVFAIILGVIALAFLPYWLR
jgi:NADH-quinone oxidoreductase subunit L